MKKKHKSSIRQVTTFVILFAIFVTLLTVTGIVRIDVRSGSNNLSEQILPNYFEVDNSSLLTEISSKGEKSIIMFTSNWCGSCLAIEEGLKELALEFKEINFYIADIEAFRANALEYNVAITPALVTLENKVFQTFQEIRPQNLRSIVSDFNLLGV